MLFRNKQRAHLSSNQAGYTVLELLVVVLIVLMLATLLIWLKSS
jgi:prepilin-type N-terminal cleavage/methylation domain-containing protein